MRKRVRMEEEKKERMRREKGGGGQVRKRKGGERYGRVKGEQSDTEEKRERR